MTTRQAYRVIRAAHIERDWWIPAYKALFYARCRSGAIRIKLSLKSNKYA